MSEKKEKFPKEFLIKYAKDFYGKVYDAHKNNLAYHKKPIEEDILNQFYEVFLEEKIPELIYLLASYKQTNDLLYNHLPQDILRLFGLNSASISDGFANPKILKDSARKAFKGRTSYDDMDKRYDEGYKDWKEMRRNIIFGSVSPYFEDATAFDRILTQILPLATRDVWETIVEFFNDKNEFTIPEHAEIIRDKYKEYCSKNKIVITKNSKKAPKNTSKWSSIRKDFALGKEDIDELFEKKKFDKIEILIKDSKNIKDARALYLCVMYLINGGNEDFCLEICRNLIEISSKENIVTVYEVLNDAHKAIIVLHYVNKINNILQWKEALVECFINSVNKDRNDIGIILSNLSDLSGMAMLAERDDFWNNLGVIKLKEVANLLWKVFEQQNREMFYNFAFSAIKFQNENVALVFTETIVAKWINESVDDEEFGVNYPKLLKLTSAKGIDVSEMIIKYSRGKIQSLQNEVSFLNNNREDEGQKMMEKLFATFEGYEQIEGLLGTIIEEEKSIDFIKNTLERAVIKFREGLEFCDILPLINMDEFLSRPQVEYNSKDYVPVNGNIIEEGDKIRIMSMGFEHKDYGLKKLPNAKKIIVRKKKT